MQYQLLLYEEGSNESSLERAIQLSQNATRITFLSFESHCTLNDSAKDHIQQRFCSISYTSIQNILFCIPPSPWIDHFWTSGEMTHSKIGNKNAVLFRANSILIVTTNFLRMYHSCTQIWTPGSLILNKQIYIYIKI